MKNSTIFLCRECGGESIRWLGQCPHCQLWNTLEEFKRPARGKGSRGSTATSSSSVSPITEVEVESVPRLQLAWEELNRVLGGGLVLGSLVLLGGEPGVGKSTLLLHLAVQAAELGRSVLYVSGEESAYQIALRAQRLGTIEKKILLLAETDLERVLEAARDCSPAVIIIDSIQTVFDPEVEALPGSVSQVRACAEKLLRLAKQSGVPVFLVGHVTKEGAIAGPRVLEHMVDTVLWLEGERSLEFRILRATKNRFGSAQEIGIFAMGEDGLEEVKDPTARLLGELSDAPGMVVLPTLEGTRPLLVEVQSLVATTPFGLPRRVATGIDLSRLHMVTAVLEKRAKLPLGNSDIFVNVSGGMRVTESAADLALALSIASNLRERPLPKQTVVIGELSLSGEVRRVNQMESRLREALRRGFTQAVVPSGVGSQPGLCCLEARDLNEALRLVGFAPHLSSATRGEDD